VEDDATLKLNHEAYKNIQLRPRRLMDVSKIDMSVDIFGTKWETPIFICPVGSQKAFYPAEGEIATAKAARAKHHLQILSTQTSTPVEEVAQALGTGLPGVPLKAATLGQPTLRRFSPGSKMLTLGREMFQHSDKGRNLFVSSDAAELPLSDE
jgi:hypothetical protein